MLQILSKWPNTTIAAFCALVLVAVFWMSVGTSPADNRAAVPKGPSVLSSQPDEPVYNQAAVSKPRRDLPEQRFIDYSVIFPQNLE